MAEEYPATVEMLRDFVDRLKVHGDLDEHPLVALLAPVPGFDRPECEGGEKGGVEERVARGLRAVWRQRFMPHVLNIERQVRWNAFFILEVMYFYPYAKRQRFPGTLKEAAMRLCDAEHLALIVADGDPEQARKLIQDYQAFWSRIIPASMTPAEQTLHSRRNASLAKLARELNRGWMMAARVGQQQAGAPVRRAGRAQRALPPASEGRPGPAPDAQVPRAAASQVDELPTGLMRNPSTRTHAACSRPVRAQRIRPGQRISLVHRVSRSRTRRAYCSAWSNAGPPSRRRTWMSWRCGGMHSNFRMVLA